MTLLDFVDRFIPEAMKNDIEMSTRSRIIVGSGFVFAIFISLNAFRGFLVGNVIMGVAIGIGGLLMLATVFALKISNSVTIAANVFVMVFSLTVYTVIYLNGGPNSEIQYNVVFIIVLGFLFCGIRVGLFWGILASLYIIVSHIMNLNGYQFPAVQEESVFINLSILFGGVIALIAVYELSGNINLKKLSVEKETSEQNAQNVQKMLEDVKFVMSRLSEGDLSKRIQVEIEGDLADLKKCVNDALEMLGQTIERVKEASREIDSGTSQVSSASQSLANGTTEQAASLEEVASSMGEIEGKARSNSENANKSSSLSSKVARKADQGNRQMEEMLTSMKRINETSAEVSKVIKVIDDIAFQTNLLALNAAVEAARAGKYGKGFAVVAEEVRNLASRSSEAAKNTTELIENSIREVEVGVKNADQTAAILKEFIVGIEEVNQIIKHISDTSEEQASGVEEINKNLGHVNHVVQQNSSISEETASASEELSSQADLLLSLMNRFNIDQKGSPVMIRAGRTAGLLEE